MTPNILFILIDDLGWADLGCFGSSFYETPHLDRLAAQGLRFTDAYASCPVCSPTRASILTGRYPAQVGITQFIGGHAVGRLCDVPYFHQMPRSEHTLAQALADGGYQTWHVGKWHLGDGPNNPESYGFHVNRGGCGWGMPKQGYFAPWGIPGLAEGADGDYLTDRLTDEAIDLIRTRDPERPFFLHLSHYAVHTPIQAPAALVGKYERKARALGLDERETVIAGDHFATHHKRHLRIQRRRLQSHPTYAAMMESLDTNIGRVLDELDAAGLTDDTLVVFTADNGGLSTAEGSPTCNAPLSEGKGWMYEGGNRVCQIARWPARIAAGSTTAVPVTSTDFYPTFLSAAGLPAIPHQHCDGVDLVPLLLRGEEPARDGIFWHYPHYSNQGDTPACAIRAGRWKLIEHFEDGRLELYDLQEDIGEEHDRAAAEPARVRELHARLCAWREEIEALIPRPNPNWRPEPLSPDCDPPEV
ncbi:MAG: sulfatase [Planctomycetota bacterium]